MEIEIIKGIQSGANAFFDSFFLLVTNMGSKVFFVIVFFLLYWCYNKKFAFNFAVGCGVASIINSGLKYVFNRPRPYMASNSIINYTNTSGGSFPSGHSSSIGVICSQLLFEIYDKKNYNKKWFRVSSIIVFVLCCFLVGFSRLYLGQHYLSDVIVGMAMGWVIGYLCHKFLYIKNDKEHQIALYLLPFLFASLFLKVDEMFTTNLQSSSMYFLVGIISAIIIGYYFEKKFVKFDVKANWVFNLFKICFGILTCFGLYFLLDLILPKVLFCEFVKTFLVGLWASLGIMVFFKWFENILKLNETLNYNKNCNDGKKLMPSQCVNVSDKEVALNEENIKIENSIIDKQIEKISKQIKKNNININDKENNAMKNIDTKPHKNNKDNKLIKKRK